MRSETVVRTDIQALRAVAVTLVLVYHLWPNRVPGGFVGVDVFFVISGFLITAHLARELESTGRVRLSVFWGRRARRLIPASVLVLSFTAMGVLVWVPAAYWRQFISEVIAATLYVENWFLATASTDYLAAENVASPVQHYWSLSAEEQFYIVWPLIIVGLAALASRMQRDKSATIAVGLGVLVALSLAGSVILTATDPAVAYFATPVRAWEFGAGGLLALLVSGRAAPARGLGGALAWCGWAVIGLSAFLIDGTTPFPGFAAMLPVVGALAVLAAAEPTVRWAPTTFLRWKPIQRVGDWSYSIYLWHWPLVVLLPFALGASLSGGAKLAILGGAVLLAAMTHRWIETPARRARGVLGRPRGALLATAAAMALVVSVAAGGLVTANALRSPAPQASAPTNGDDSECVGVTAFAELETCGQAVEGRAVRPDVATIFEDTGGAFRCYEYDKVADPETCSFGSERANATRIALLGDSHGAMLIPGLRTVATARNWRITTWVGNGCVWRAEGAESDECSERRRAVDAALRADPFDAIILTARRVPDSTASSAATAEALYARAWQQQIDLGARVIVIADNPRVTQEAIDCVLRNANDAVAARQCLVAEDSGFAPRDQVAEAAKASGLAEVVDLADLYCHRGECPLVAGDVMIYRDEHHITATYSREIASELARRLAAALER